MTSEIIGPLANLALTLSVIVALVFGIAQVKAAARDRRERFSLEALGSFQTRDFVQLLQYINSHQLPDSGEGLLKLPTEEQVTFIQFAYVVAEVRKDLYELAEHPRRPFHESR